MSLQSTIFSVLQKYSAFSIGLSVAIKSAVKIRENSVQRVKPIYPYNPYSAIKRFKPRKPAPRLGSLAFCKYAIGGFSSNNVNNNIQILPYDHMIKMLTDRIF